MTKNIKKIYQVLQKMDFNHGTGYPTVQQVIAQMLFREGVTYDIFKKMKAGMSDPMKLGIENELIKLEKWISLPNLPAFKLD